MTTEILTERRTEAGRILVADSDETFNGLVAELLHARGYDCDVARDMAGAERHLSAANYDLVIANVEMPDTPDLALARRVASACVPVIVIAERPSLESALSAIDLSVSAYLVKPIHVRDFLVRVQAAMRMAGLRQLVQAAHERLRIAEQMLARSQQPRAGNRADNDLQAFLMLALGTVIHGVSDIEELAERMSERVRGSHPCRLLHCPRLQATLSAIAETVVVLEGTKTAFRSRQLGELRERLQSLLDEMSPTLVTSSVNSRVTSRRLAVKREASDVGAPSSTQADSLV